MVASTNFLSLTWQVPTRSQNPWMLERLAEGFAQAMDDDFNSREGVAKVLAATKQLSTS